MNPLAGVGLGTIAVVDGVGVVGRLEVPGSGRLLLVAGGIVSRHYGELVLQGLDIVRVVRLLLLLLRLSSTAHLFFLVLSYPLGLPGFPLSYLPHLQAKYFYFLGMQSD